MVRPIRMEYEDAVYHVTARGNERRAIYRDDRDRVRFLETLQEAASRRGRCLGRLVLYVHLNPGQGVNA